MHHFKRCYIRAMRRWIVRFVILIALVAGGYWLQESYLAPQPEEVSVIKVDRGPVEWTVTNSKAGTVKARRRARLSPEIGGRVIDLPHREGDLIRTGDILLRLDDSVQQAQHQRAERDLVASEARRKQTCLAAKQASRELARYEALAERQIVSASLLDQLRSASETAAAACDASGASVNSAEATIEVIRTQIRKAVLRAPFSGVVAEVSVELGEWTTPSPPATPLPPAIEIIDTASIYVSAPMDEVDSARILAEQRARVTLDPFPDRSFDAVVVRVAPYVLDVEAQNRTVEIEAELEAAEFAAALLPGTSADVEVILDNLSHVLRIPTATLLQGNAVFLVEEGILVRRPVETGLRNWDFTEIVSGLEVGDEIVTTLDRAGVQPGNAAVVVSDTENN